MTTGNPPRAGCLADDYRDAVAHIATAVAVVRSTIGEERTAAFSTGVVPVSTEPPMVLVSIDRQTRLGTAIDRSGEFVISFLADTRRDLVLEAGGTWAHPGRLSALVEGFEAGDSVAQLECKVTERMTSSTHLVFVALVCAAHTEEGRPLISFRGSADRLGS